MREDVLTINLKSIVALTCADVEIFLLKNKEQTDWNEKETFTRDEIIAQLHKTMVNITQGLEKMGYDIDKPLDPHDKEKFVKLILNSLA